MQGHRHCDNDTGTEALSECHRDRGTVDMTQRHRQCWIDAETDALSE